MNFPFNYFNFGVKCSVYLFFPWKLTKKSSSIVQLDNWTQVNTYYGLLKIAFGLNQKNNRQFDLTIRHIWKTVDIVLCQLFSFAYFNIFCSTYIIEKFNVMSVVERERHGWTTHRASVCIKDNCFKLSYVRPINEHEQLFKPRLWVFRFFCCWRFFIFTHSLWEEEGRESLNFQISLVCEKKLHWTRQGERQ